MNSATKLNSSLPRLYLLYHELRHEASRYSYVLKTEVFERQVEMLARLRLSNAAALWPEITFDDGHASNADIALPILLKHKMQARFFITVGWTESRPGYMSWRNLRALLEAGQQVGAHGWSHTLLTHCNERELQHELHDARRVLEDRLGMKVETVSMPGGRYNRRVIAACRKADYKHIYTSMPRAEALPLGELVGRLNILQSMSPEWMEDIFLGRCNTLAELEKQYHRKAAIKTVLGDGLYEKVWAVLNRREEAGA